MKTTISFIGIVLTGLSAGLFYAWAVSVIPGTRRISDASYLETMQTINRAILNPAFFLVFFGALIFDVWGTLIEYKAGIGLSFWLSLSATLVYLLGTFGITALGNVPLNETLDAIDLTRLDSQGMLNARKAYEARWNLLNTVRTGASIMAFLLLLWASRVPGTSQTTFI